jgi:tRNA 2-thiouridine synthesizing protein E
MSVREIAGKTIAFDEDGFVANYEQWNKAVAEALAAELGIVLNEQHWAIINFCRSDFAVQGQSPTLRRITQAAGVPTKELYQLFPKVPAKKVAYVAGLKKPSGCI